MKPVRLILPDGTEYYGWVMGGNRNRDTEAITLNVKLDTDYAHDKEPQMDEQTYRGQILSLASMFLQWNGQEESTAPTPEQVFALADGFYAWASADNRMERLMVVQTAVQLLAYNGQQDSTLPTESEGYALIERIWQWIYRDNVNEMQLRKGLFQQAYSNLQWRAQLTMTAPTPDQVFTLAGQMSQWVEAVE